VRRITAAVVTVMVALAFGCEGNGSTFDQGTGPLQCQAIQGAQDANNYSNCLSYTNGGGGGSGSGTNSAGLAPAALYRLIRVNGDTLPFNLMPGGVEDSTTTDSVRVINFILDSSYISLNSDSTVTRIDYLNIRDRRSGATNPSTVCAVTPILVADTSSGVFSDSSGQPVIELLAGFQIQNVGWQYNGDTLTATTPYELHDAGCLPTQLITTAYFTYQNVGSPYNNTQRTVPYRGRLHGSAAATPVGAPRIGGAGLGLVGGNNRGGSFVGVVGQQH
jgi:hypothetical protein